MSSYSSYTRVPVHPSSPLVFSRDRTSILSFLSTHVIRASYSDYFPHSILALSYDPYTLIGTNFSSQLLLFFFSSLSYPTRVLILFHFFFPFLYIFSAVFGYSFQILFIIPFLSSSFFSVLFLRVWLVECVMLSVAPMRPGVPGHCQHRRPGSLVSPIFDIQ